MQTTRKELRGTRAYTVPLFGIVVLLACYWLITDWQRLPLIVGAMLDAVHLPH